MHPSAITTAQKMRAADIAAYAASNDASHTSLAAAASIHALPQLHDADVIVLIHALCCAMQRSGHGHIDRWGNLADELTGWVPRFDEAVRADRADRAEVRRAA